VVVALIYRSIERAFFFFDDSIFRGRDRIWLSQELLYSLRPILLFANTDVSTIKMCLNTSILGRVLWVGEIQEIASC
jgi:hypothetical protein